MQGILFRPEMIVAIQDGSKTVTRRVIKELKEPDRWECGSIVEGQVRFYNVSIDKAITLKPRFRIGEVVYVKEALYRNPYFNEAGYLLDRSAVMVNGTIGDMLKWRWKRDTLSPMFMPADAARDFIKILDVKAQRLQEISLEDCKAEGIYGYTFARACLSSNPPDPRWGFIELWDTINPKFKWSTNPWVWKYTFELEL